MERKYVNGTTNEASMFIGYEVEHTPAHQMKTLFVVGLQDRLEIADLAYDEQIKHVYFGANQSFAPTSSEDWEKWEGMIKYILESGYWATLDFDLRYAEQLHETCLTELRRFIPQISIKLPYLSLFNYNTTIKIDDKGFDATNPGVWCFGLHNLLDRNHFTSWDEYDNDKVIK